MDFIKKAFVLSPFEFAGFQLRWILCGHKYKRDSRVMAVARHTHLQNYRNKIIWRLKKKYRKLMPKLKERIDSEYNKLSHDSDGRIWVCWLQGMEQAPDIVKICFESIRRHFSNREVVLITEENYTDYITLPNYIVEKARGGISAALLSDLIRLNLLIDYGGTWIDATILWTSDDIPNYMLDGDLFLPSTTFEETFDTATRIYNYYITARKNNKLLLMVRELLYEYWKKYNVAIEYLIFYDFFEIAIEIYPEEWRKVIPFPCAECTILVDNLTKPYSPELYKELTSRSPFQKLTWRFLPVETDGNTVLDYVLTLPKWGENKDATNQSCPLCELH